MNLLYNLKKWDINQYYIDMLSHYNKNSSSVKLDFCLNNYFRVNIIK